MAGKSSKKSDSRKQYWDTQRLLKRKQRNVFNSSHGKWTYEDLIEHQKKKEAGKKSNNKK